MARCVIMHTSTTLFTDYNQMLQPLQTHELAKFESQTVRFSPGRKKLILHGRSLPDMKLSEMSNLPSTCPTLPLSFFYFLFLLLPFLVISQSPASDQTVLLNVKQQLGNPPTLGAWNSTSSPCNWPAIQCTNGRVTSITFWNMNFTGKVPPAICEVENLQELDLSFNLIPGEFPTVLYNCSKLRYLDLSQNCFVGAIPADIDRMSSLQYIDLGANNFSGNIPPAIGRLPELRSLSLYGNLFHGTFPSEIGNLSNLQSLNMSFNMFLPARIPAEFGKLKNLKFMWMTETNLMGEIPESFSNLSSLEYLQLSVNNLTGSIPRGIFQLKNLSHLYLYKNQLSGEIPTPIESVNLIDLDLSMNKLTGTIPEDFGKLRQLELFNLFVNRFYGEIPRSIMLIPTMKNFSVFGNRLNGTLPPEFGLHSKLEGFEVSDNKLTGTLPENLCAGKALLGVVAFSNYLTGELPESLGNCSSLITVQLYNNNFSGELPSGLWTAFNLSILLLSGNRFSGELPKKISANLSLVEISNNKFSGRIPTEISSWSSLVVFKASNNLISGEIPGGLTSLSQLITLMLDGNSIAGQFPSRIESWRALITLNLARNKLFGQIPSSISSLPNLLNLDLSENQFSGQIPPELGQLKLTTLNLSSNQLNGKIPYAFANLAYETSFLNNSNLCSNIPVSFIPNCLAKTRNSEKFPPGILAVILVLGAIVFLVTGLLIFFILRDSRRKKKLMDDLAEWKVTSFQRLTFTKENIISSLTENNLIASGGSGKVYKVAANRSGDYVAVKRIRNWNNGSLDDKLEKEFLAEVQILSTIRHSNIVKLMCCFSSEDSNLLVYEYMENQCLYGWLHGTHRIRRAELDWPTRLQIAIGAAQGLCYMHHDCSPPIIHRDVKSSNILLDSEFNAKIADFGLARILARRVEASTVSAVAGSIGYIAPEYAFTTRVNEKIDVYSFGVVLLELLTGREPGNGDKHSNLAEWAWFHCGERNAIADSLDEEIKKPCYLEEMTTVFKLGLICTSKLPSSRPSMKEVLQFLCHCRNLEGSNRDKTGSEYEAAPLIENARDSSGQKRSGRVSDEEEGSFECRV